MELNFMLSENGTTIDLSVLQDLVGEDVQALQTIIELFINTMPPAIEKMKFYQEQKDWENLFKTAHTMKSSVSIIKVDGLYEAVVDIESKAENKTGLDHIRPAIDTIALKYTMAEKLLRKELQKYQSNS